MGGKSSKTTQTVAIPQDVLNRYNAVNKSAQQVASKPFQTYSNDPNAFVAPINATQQAGIDATSQAVGTALPYFQQATGQLLGAQNATQPFYGQAVQSLGQGQQAGSNYIDQSGQALSGAQGAGQALTGQALGQLQAGLAAAYPYQAQAGQNYTQAENVGGYYGQRATGALQQGNMASQPYYQSGLQSVNQGSQYGQGLSAAALGSLDAGYQASSPYMQASGGPQATGSGNALQTAEGAQQGANALQSGAAQSYGQSLTNAQPYNQSASQNYEGALQGSQPYQALATGLGLQGAQAVNPTELNQAAIEKYLSPYLSNVLQGTAGMLNQTNQQAMSGQLGNAIKSGAFGGDRAGLAAANLAQQQQLANAQIFSDILNQGYGQALSTAQQQQGVQLGAEQANRAAIAAAAPLMQSIGQQGYAQQLGVGQAQQGLGQQIYNQLQGYGQAQQGLGQQVFQQGLGLGGLQQSVAQQQYGQNLNTAQQNLAAGQALFGQGAQAAGIQGDLAQQLYGQGLSSGQYLSNLGQQQFGQGLSTSQQLGQLGQQLYGQQLGTGQAQAELGQQLYGQGLGASQQTGQLGQQAFSQGLDVSQQLGQLGQQAFGQGALTAEQLQNLAQSIYGTGSNTAQQLAALGAGAQESALQGAQAQLAAGTLQQQTQQAGLEALYNQFLQQQSYPFQVQQFLANIAMGTGALSGSTTTTTQPGGLFSDERLKEDIEPIGETFDGQQIVRYRYKDDPTMRMGLIAQDVEKKHPDAVGSAAGFKTVDYEKATDEAVENARSQGGLVLPGSGVQGFAGGGLVGYDPSFWQSLMQRKSAQSPMGGGPLSGAGGIVPAANLPVGQLQTAGPAPQQPSTAERVNEMTDAANNVYGAWNKFKDWRSSDNEDTDGDSQENGLRIGRAMGGGLSKLDIPTQALPKYELQTPGAPPPQKSDADKMGDIAKVAMMVMGMNQGGAVKGYAGGGGVDDILRRLGLTPSPQPQTMAVRPSAPARNGQTQYVNSQGAPAPRPAAGSRVPVAAPALIGGGLVPTGATQTVPASTSHSPGAATRAAPMAINPETREADERAAQRVLSQGLFGGAFAGPDKWRALAEDQSVDPSVRRGAASLYANYLRNVSTPTQIDQQSSAPAQTLTPAQRLFLQQAGNPAPAQQPQPQRNGLIGAAMAAPAPRNITSQSTARVTPRSTAPARPASQPGLAAAAPAPVEEPAEQIELMPEVAAAQPGMEQFATAPDMEGFQPVSQGVANENEPEVAQQGALGRAMNVARRAVSGARSQSSYLDKLLPGGEAATSQEVIPFLTALATMATAPTEHFVTALGAGVGAGAQSYSDIQRQRAELAKTAAETGRTEAETQGLGLEQLAAAQQIAKDAMYLDQLGRPRVRLADGRNVSIQEYNDMGRPPTIGQVEVGSRAEAPSGAYTPQAPPPVPSARAPEISVPQGVTFGDAGQARIERDLRNLETGGVNASAVEASGEAYNNMITGGMDARRALPNILTMAAAVSQSPDTGALAPGVFADIRAKAVAGANDVLRSLGIPYQFGADDLANKQIMDKLQQEGAFGRASVAQQNSLAGLQMATITQPGARIEKHAAAELAANNWMQNQIAIDLMDYVEAYRAQALERGGPNAFLAQNAESSFWSENPVSRYQADRNDVANIIEHHPELLQDLVTGDVTPDQVTQYFVALGKPHLAKYFVRTP